MIVSWVPDRHRFELLENGGFGWSLDWSQAYRFAREASARLQKRHRVYWSSQGNAWMVRRAFNLAPVDRSPHGGEAGP